MFGRPVPLFTKAMKTERNTDGTVSVTGMTPEQADAVLDAAVSRLCRLHDIETLAGTECFSRRTAALRELIEGITKV